LSYAALSYAALSYAALSYAALSYAALSYAAENMLECNIWWYGFHAVLVVVAALVDARSSLQQQQRHTRIVPA